MEIFIRDAALDDAEDITRLTIQLGYPSSADVTLQNLTIIFKNQNEKMIVAVHNKTCVGWAQVSHTTRLETGSFVEIVGLVVDDQYRNKGIGKTLIAYCKSWCIDKGVKTLRLRSNIKRKEAHESYYHLGFSEIKQQKVFEIKLSP